MTIFVEFFIIFVCFYLNQSELINQTLKLFLFFNASGFYILQQKLKVLILHVKFFL